MKEKKTMHFQMRLNPDVKDEAILDIFDDIGEHEDWLGEKHGFGPSAVSAFLADNPTVDKIHVRINSKGGDVFDGIAVHNLLKASGKSIEVEIVGLAASIASVIAMAGDTIRMHKISQLMVHNCWTWAMGNASDFRKLADDMDKIMESSKIAYLDRAGEKLTAPKLDQLLEAETYLTAQEAYDFGLCDEIIGVEQPVEEKEENAEPVVEQVRQHKKCWFF